MNLRDYMYFHRLTCKQMAKQLGVHSVYLSTVKNLKRRPGYELAMKIEKLTNGEVTIKELREKNDNKK